MDLAASQLSKFVMMKIDVRDDLRIDYIDANLGDETAARALGDAWLAASAACVCRVRSALASEAFNYLVNPLHPDIDNVIVEAIAPLAFDARLFQ